MSLGDYTRAFAEVTTLIDGTRSFDATLDHFSMDSVTMWIG